MPFSNFHSLPQEVLIDCCSLRSHCRSSLTFVDQYIALYFQCRISNKSPYVASIACLQTLTPSPDFIACGAFTGDRIWDMHESLRVFEAKPCDYKLVQFNGTHWIYSCGRIISEACYPCKYMQPTQSRRGFNIVQFLMTFSIHAKQQKKTKIYKALSHFISSLQSYQIANPDSSL